MGTYVDSRARRRPPGRYAPHPPPPPPVRRPTIPQRRDPLWAKLCLILGALVMVVSGTMVVLPRVLASWAIGDVQEDLLPDELLGENIDGPINLLMLGIDQRSGNTTEPIRTDTMIIVHIPATHDHVYMVSLPRDTEVDIPDFPEAHFKGWRTKLNAAFAFGSMVNGKPDAGPTGRARGVKLLAMTLNGLVPGGIKFNGVAVVDFWGFRYILDIIGGVHMCVDERTTSVMYDKEGKYHTFITDINKRYVYEKGCRDMQGWEALDFARQRYNVTGGDYGRQKHQQQLLMAIFKKLMSKGTLTDPAKLIELQHAAGDLLTVDLGKTEVVDWIFTLKGLRAEDITMIKMNGGVPNAIPGTTNEGLTADSMALLKAVHDDKLYDFVVRHPTWVATEK